MIIWSVFGQGEAIVGAVEPDTYITMTRSAHALQFIGRQSSRSFAAGRR